MAAGNYVYRALALDLRLQHSPGFGSQDFTVIWRPLGESTLPSSFQEVVTVKIGQGLAIEIAKLNEVASSC
ncbi:hypothetical protein FRB93_012981 [Tulasnella sp. JGI-2019a]|nr:hypothetical protein FRB93_012981 [Tulasnella sp. JGI-2019a]